MDRKTLLKAELKKELDAARIDICDKVRKIKHEWQDILVKLEQIELIEANLQTLDDPPEQEASLTLVQFNELKSNCPYYDRYFYGLDSNEWSWGCDFQAKDWKNLPDCKPTRECLKRLHNRG